jgi:hypothetical protein
MDCFASLAMTGNGCREEKMTKTAFDKIKAGLGDAKAYFDGSRNKRDYGIRVPAPANVKKTRSKLSRRNPRP